MLRSVYGVILRNWVPIVAAYSIGIAGGVTALVAFETAASNDKGTALSICSRQFLTANTTYGRHLSRPTLLTVDTLRPKPLKSAVTTAWC